MAGSFYAIRFIGVAILQLSTKLNWAISQCQIIIIRFIFTYGKLSRTLSGHYYLLKIT